MKKGNLFNTIAFIFSFMLLIVSGAIYVYSAQQQSVSSSLSVTFSGQNVNFEAQGWYHVDGGSRTAMVNSQGGNTVSFSATETSVEKTLKISNTEAENKAVLTSEHPYVLFTYKFVNTASSGAFGMEVSLNITPTPTNLKTIKYASSTTLYNEASLDDFKSSVTGTSTFSNEFIVANNGTKYFYILFEVDDLTLPVTFNPTFSWSVVCSDSVTNTPQETPISNFAVSNNQITGVEQNLPATLVIPSSVTGIMNEAFKNNTSITSVYIPSSVKGIGWNAFSGCTNLSSVEFEDTSNWYATNYSVNELKTLTNTSDNASMLKTAYANGGRADCYWTKTTTKPIDIAATQTTTVLGVDTSTHTTNRSNRGSSQKLAIANIVVPYGIVGIESSNEWNIGPFGGHLYAIDESSNNNDIKTVILPESVTSIGDGAFEYCLITSITIPSGVTSIGEYAFMCTNLTSVTIPSSVTSIGLDAFMGCSNLTSVTFENNTGWWYADTDSATSGTAIDVSNATTNATNLGSWSGAWQGKYLKRS